MNIKQLNAQDENFWKQLDELLAWESVSNDQVFNVVNDVLKNVRQRGDQAVVEYTNKFDRMNVKDMSELEISKDRIEQALNNIPQARREALEKAA